MEEVLLKKPNADIPHLLDCLVFALAVYATAFRSKLSLDVYPPSPKERQVLFPTLPKQSHSLIVWGPPFTSRYFLLALPPCKRSLLTCRVLHCGLGDSEKRSSRKGGQVQLGWFVVSHHNVHPRVHQIPIIKSLFPCPRARILPEVILSRTSTHEQTRLFC